MDYREQQRHKRSVEDMHSIRMLSYLFLLKYTYEYCPHFRAGKHKAERRVTYNFSGLIIADTIPFQTFDVKACALKIIILFLVV